MFDSLFQVFVVLSLALFSMRWIIPSMIKVSSAIIKKKDYEPTVSIIMSCFNEGQDVYNTLVSLAQINYPKNKFVVIVIDDCSTDDSYDWILKAAAEHSCIRPFKNKTNMGKHRNVLAGAAMTKSEIILCTDSDLIYEKDVLTQLVQSFSDEKIGAVGGVVGVKNSNKNIMTRWQTMIYHYGFNLWKMPEIKLRTVFCISGCLFAIKRKVFEIIRPKIEERNWFGIEVKGGEDRYMTHQVLMAGYDTIVNTDARCYTTAPPSLKQLFMQQLRWKRSGLMMFFWALRRPMQHVNRFNSASLSLLLLPPSLSLTVLAMYITSLLTGVVSFLMFGKFLFTIMVFSCVAFGSSIVLNYFSTGIVKQDVTGFFFLPGLMFWYVVIDQFFLPLLAMLTLDEKGWSSR